jgi:polyphosphate kinase 2 (PPK2 family)
MNRFRVRLGCRVRLKEYDPNDTGDYNKNDDGKTAAKKETERHVGQLSNLQERLFANGSRSLLIVLQGMDTSGKDGTIKSDVWCEPPGMQGRLIQDSFQRGAGS